MDIAGTTMSYIGYSDTHREGNFQWVTEGCSSEFTAWGGGEPVTVFESGAILMYLAEKTGRFLPKDNRLRVQAIEWLMWQMGGLGPMLGQNHHFNRYAPEKVPYAVRRYTNETLRLYAVLDRRLQGREFIAEEYSILGVAFSNAPSCMQF